MLTKGTVKIGLEWRFGADWPGPRCGAKTRRGKGCQRPANKKNGRCRLHGGASTDCVLPVKSGFSSRSDG